MPAADQPTEIKIQSRSSKSLPIHSKSPTMASSHSFPLLSLLLLLLLFSPKTTTNATISRRSKLTTSEEEEEFRSQSSPQTPITFFEVTKPIPTPRSKPCSTLLLRHDFAATYGKPPVTSPYAPPSCLRGRRPSLAVLEWSAACTGRQFDRIFGVWLSGAELLRSCTAEPRPAPGIAWSVRKDVTRYSSLLSRPQTLQVYMGNLVDQTYTGIYHANVSIHFWFRDEEEDKKHDQPNKPGFDSPADLILPVSRSLPLNDGLWFEIQNSTDFQSKEVAVPRNAYRAVLEVYVSPHQNDEFWYGNPPNEYLKRNNISGQAGNGAFREVVVSLDGNVVGAVWPFTVIYTGGINPLLWRPITGIGSFDLPSYDIEITPFLGKILDGKKHRFGFGVTDALDVWYIDANLHLWLDGKMKQTTGQLIKHVAPEFKPSLVSKFKGLDGDFDTRAKRQISVTGWVKSSYGKITTNFFQTFDFKNFMEYKGNGSIQIVNQTIDYSHGVYAEHPSSVVYSEHVFQNFPLYMNSGTTDQIGDTYSLESNVTLGFNEQKFSGEHFGFAFSSLRNMQNGHATMHVKGNLVQGGVGSTQQVYKYESMHSCYFRNVSSSNYTILHDVSGDDCTKGSGFILPS